MQDHDPIYKQKVKMSLDKIPPEQRLSNREKEDFEWRITSAQVINALRLAKNGTAMGMDGCLYKLWKKLDERYNAACKANRTGFDITGALAAVFRDIQDHGVDKRSDLP